MRDYIRERRAIIAFAPESRKPELPVVMHNKAQLLGVFLHKLFVAWIVANGIKVTNLCVRHVSRRSVARNFSITRVER